MVGCAAGGGEPPAFGGGEGAAEGGGGGSDVAISERFSRSMGIASFVSSVFSSGSMAAGGAVLRGTTSKARWRPTASHVSGW